MALIFLLLSIRLVGRRGDAKDAAAEARQVMITLCLPLTNAVSQSQSW